MILAITCGAPRQPRVFDPGTRRVKARPDRPHRNAKSGLRTARLRTTRRPSLEPVRILLVDSDEPFRAVVRAMLERRGYRTREASDARQALKILVGGGVEAIVVDLAQGPTAIGDLKAAAYWAKLIAISDGCATELAASAGQGADASLPKTSIAALAALLDVLLDHSPL